MKCKIHLCILGVLVMGMALFEPVRADEVVDRIVAIVNEDIVTEYDIEKKAAVYIEKINASNYSQEHRDRLIQKVKNDILDNYIEQALTAQEAKRYGIAISDAEIDTIIENIKTQRSLTQENFEHALVLEGLTLDEFRENIRKQQMQSKIINFAVKEKTVVTQSDIKAYYDEHTKEYEGVKKYYLRNILMPEQEKIMDVKKQADENGSFVELARQYSTASNAEQGGDLGLFNISDFSGPIKESLSKLEKGQTSDVIETAQGFQIFYIQDIVVEGKKAYEQAAKEIEQKLYREQVEKHFETWLETLKKNAHIRRML